MSEKKETEMDFCLIVIYSVVTPDDRAKRWARQVVAAAFLSFADIPSNERVRLYKLQKAFLHENAFSQSQSST